MNRSIIIWLFGAAFICSTQGSGAAEIPALKTPARGTLNLKAAETWEDGLLCGNGNLGAIVENTVIRILDSGQNRPH